MMKIIRAAAVMLVVVCTLPGFLMSGCKKTQPKEEAPQAAKGINAPAAQPPADAMQHVKHGVELMKSNDYDAAVKEFSAAIGTFPGYDLAYNDRAGAYMRLNKFDKAKDDLDKALQINPHSPVTYYNLASLYALQKKSDLALDSLDKALEVGFKDYDYLRADPDLNNIRKLPGYKKILEAHKVYVPK